MKSTGIFDTNGNEILSYDYIEQLREEDAEQKKKNFICAQRGGQERVLANNADICITGGSRGGPLDVNTLVNTVDGYKKIDSLTSGDKVYKPDGEIQEVVFKEYHGDLPCYELIFSNGSSVVASYDHTWSISINESEEFEDYSTEDVIVLLETDTVNSIDVPMSFETGDRVKITGAKFIGKRECCCIHVDGEDMLFVVNGGIVTHNSKSFSILLECVKDAQNPNFNALILRRELPDLDSLIRDSKIVLKDYGQYLSSDKSMLWQLDAGGTIKFNFHAGATDDFIKRFQGKQYSLVAIDELTHLDDIKKFFYILTCLRNAHGLRNRFIGSCNPDRNSWLRGFIDYWIGNQDTIYSDGKKHPEWAGYPIPERNGKVRYCCTSGAETLADIIWGDTREEVWKKAKPRVQEIGAYSPEMEVYGKPEDLFVMSVAFVEAKLTDNKKLLEGDPSYIARLANQSRSSILADLRGNWDAQELAEEMVTEEDMNRFFNNPRQVGDGIRRMSDDVALEGGDNNWLWLIEGNHVIDVDVCTLNSQELVEHIEQKRREWGVNEENLTFDSNGIGGLLKGFFKRAIPFNNLESPYGATDAEKEAAKRDYDTLKSQCMVDLAKCFKYGEISIAPYLLDRRFSGKGFENMTLRDILMQERRVIAIDQKKKDQGKGQCIIQKSEMKKLIGRSPDCMESLAYWRIFSIKKPVKKVWRPTGAATFTSGSHPSSTTTRVIPANRRFGVRYI